MHSFAARGNDQIRTIKGDPLWELACLLPQFDRVYSVSKASTSAVPGDVAGPQRVTANAAAAFARRAA